MRRLVPSACRAWLVVNGCSSRANSRIAKAGAEGSNTTPSRSRSIRPARSACRTAGTEPPCRQLVGLGGTEGLGPQPQLQLGYRRFGAAKVGVGTSATLI